MARTIDGRLAYADLLRTLATLAAIVLYTSVYWLDRAAAGSASYTILNTYNALTRWCAPMFAMLSGAFLLDPKKGVKLRDIFLRYILRILIVLLVWGTLYALIDHGWSSGRLTWGGVKSALTHVLWADTHSHLWFLYILLGLYLITPVLRAFVRGASRGDLHWFLLLAFLFGSLLPTLESLFPDRMALPAAWADRMDITLILGYVGCYVAGYYLKNYTLGRLSEFTLYILGILGAVATVWGNSVLPAHGVLLRFTSPNVLLTAVAVFVLFRYVLGVSDERSRRQRLSGTARITMGIYLLHSLCLMLLDHFGITTLSFNPVLSVPVLSAGVFLVCFAVVWLPSRIPLLGRLLT